MDMVSVVHSRVDSPPYTRPRHRGPHGNRSGKAASPGTHDSSATEQANRRERTMTGTMPVFDMLSDTLAGTYVVSTPMRDGLHVKSYVTVGDDPRRVKITGDMFDPNRVVVTVYHEHSPRRKAELAYHTANYRTADDLVAAALDWLKAALAGG